MLNLSTQDSMFNNFSDQVINNKSLGLNMKINISNAENSTFSIVNMYI